VSDLRFDYTDRGVLALYRGDTAIYSDRVDLGHAFQKRRYLDRVREVTGLDDQTMRDLGAALEELAGQALKAAGGLQHHGQNGQGQAVAAPGDGPTTPATRVLTTSTGPWVPFPSSTLPDPFGSFVHQTARARQCDPAAVALPLLSCLAGVIGNSRTVRIWPDWYAPAILWTALICRSGAVKSPGFYAAREPLDRLERKARTLFESEHADFELAEAKFQAAIQDWKRAKPGARGEPPIRETEEPTPQRFIVEDVTLQVLGRILSENPRGLLLGRDELSGWIRSFDQFTGSVGADVARWLEIHRGRSLSVDRAGAGHTYVPRAAISACGTIQDEVVVNVFSGEHLANGLLSRFLLAQPPEPRRRWCSSRTASDITDTVADRFAALSKLDLPEGDDLPRALGLSAEAEGIYAAWFNALNERRRDTEPGPFRSALAKAEEIPGRLGLILALGRSDHPATVEAVDVDTMQRAIALADWFANEIERVLGTFSETPEAREARKLVEWSRERGEATARDVARGIRKYSGRGGSERAETDLRALVSAGDLVAEDHPGGPAGGRPTVIYKPTSPSTSSKPMFFSENNGVLSTSTGSTPLESPPEPEPDPPATPGPEPDPVDLFDTDEPSEPPIVPGNGNPDAEPFALHSAVVMALLVDGAQRPEGLADRPEIRAHDATAVALLRPLEELAADGWARRRGDGTWEALRCSACKRDLNEGPGPGPGWCALCGRATGQGVNH
jgi:uncharacterized protein DUF3987